jgi:lysophospholipase L1-like esterase
MIDTWSDNREIERGRDMIRRSPLVLAVAIAITVLGPSLTAGAQEPWPNSMAALGNSITRGYNSGPLPYQDNPSYSWSTGTNANVRSHYLRILDANPAIAGKNFNDARSGAKMADLAGQAAVANGQQVDYITILMGGNDVCASSEAAMTPIATFRAEFETATSDLAGGSPNAKIYVVSIPDVYNLGVILHNDPSARFVWSFFRICQSLLARPNSTAQAEVDRRARVRQRNIDYNQQLQDVCGAFATCRYDGGVAFNTKFVTSDVSTRDYFHPSAAGQAKLAAVSWGAGYWGP